LGDDVNEKYFTTEDKENWLTKCSEEEEWLDMEGFNGSKNEFR
jgi:hypothetical protein